MRKCKITVWNYGDFFGSGGRNKEASPISYEVEAHCVGGDEGILAFFFLDNWFCVAKGDDGHWWMSYFCDGHWAKEIKETIIAAL